MEVEVQSMTIWSWSDADWPKVKLELLSEQIENGFATWDSTRHSTIYFPSAVSSGIALAHQNSALITKMLRTGAVRALRAATRAPALRQATPVRSQLPSLLQSSRATTPFAVQSIRCYSAPSGLSNQEVQGRIMDLLKNFDKVTDASKV